jgi:hypothetical protein
MIVKQERRATLRKTRWRWMMVFLGSAALADAFSQEKMEPAIKYSGYLQGEMRRNSGEGANVTESDVRRARFKVDAHVSPHASLVLQLDAAREIQLRDAYADLGMGRLKLRLGQFKVPFSAQVLESSTTRLAPERVLINTRSVPGERERGALLELRLGKDASPILQLGAFNGRGANQTENNTDKDYLAAFHFSAKPVSARLAYLNGKYKNPAPPAGSGRTLAKSRLSADVQFDLAPIGVQAQYALGEGDFPAAAGAVSATDVQGGFAQFWFRKNGSPLTLFAGYQKYDPDIDARKNTIHGPHVGIVYDGNKMVRYTLAGERLDDRRTSGKRNILTLRAQVKY